MKQRGLAVQEVGADAALPDGFQRDGLVGDFSTLDQMFDIPGDLIVDNELFVAEILLQLTRAADPFRTAQGRQQRIHHLLRGSLTIRRMRPDIHDRMVDHQLETAVLEHLLAEERQKRLLR